MAEAARRNGLHVKLVTVPAMRIESSKEDFEALRLSKAGEASRERFFWCRDICY